MYMTTSMLRVMSPDLDDAAREALAKRFILLDLQNALPRADLDTAHGLDG